jgi:TldD protein
MNNQNHFFQKFNLNPEKTFSLINNTIGSLDDGEIFLEQTENESISFVDKVIKSCSVNSYAGFGFRGVSGEIVTYAYSSDISPEAMAKASSTVSLVKKYTQNIHQNISPDPGLSTKENLYPTSDIINQISAAKKIVLMQEIDDYLRSRNELVKQVSININTNYSIVQILRKDGFVVTDHRPLIACRISVIVDKNGRREQGFSGFGGRVSALDIINVTNFKKHADEALRVALVNLSAEDAPAGEKTVVLGNGWPGILLHEAIGHGLEGDFNRKKTSAFSGLMGKKVAADNVTILDDGTLPGRRGSLNFDDEGTPSQRTVLVENGILVGYMQDRLNARLMNMKPTGNGRRQDYTFAPLPRMTNTYMLAGSDNHTDMLTNIKDGIYAKSFSGGNVDIVSGKFVFNASESYLIENGKITKPLKGVSIIGNGPDVLTKIIAVGKDLELDLGTGTCGKEGQGVPVGVGQPTLAIKGLTIGGTKIS